jgi:cytochrome oxidase assembly protein ShyY1
VPVPSGEIRLEGLALPRFPRAFDFGRRSGGSVRQNLSVEDFVAETGLAVKSFVLEQQTDTGDGLVRDWPRPDTGVEMHESYALQWYSLAALSIVLGAVFAFRKR